METTPKINLLEPFSLELYEKEPERLRDDKGMEAASSRVTSHGALNVLTVIWNPEKVGVYMLNQPKDVEMLRLKSKKVLMQTGVWINKAGYYVPWQNYGQPPCTKEAVMASSQFDRWDEGSFHTWWSEEGAKFGCPTTILQKFHDQSDLYKVPRTGAVTNWKIVLEHDPNATVGLDNMLWFFGGTPKSLGERIQAGTLPQPLVPTVFKKSSPRRWLLQSVAQFQNLFTPMAKGTA